MKKIERFQARILMQLDQKQLRACTIAKKQLYIDCGSRKAALPKRSKTEEDNGDELVLFRKK